MEKINISGNFDTEKRELEAVKILLDKYGVKYDSVKKCSKADDGDVVVTAYGKRILIEVKEEDYETRFKLYKELGIDFLSVFVFKPTVQIDDWSGVKKPNMYRALSDAIDRDNISYKKGKMYYSKSHLWLFYSLDNGEFKYARFFDGKEMTSDKFRRYLFKNCKFAVNNKPSEQLSCNDGYQSAVIYVKGEDPQLNKYRVEDLEGFIKSIP